MIYFPVVMGALFALSVESYTIPEQDENPNIILCNYPKSASKDIEYNSIPITETMSPEDDYVKELKFHLKDEEIKINLKPSDGYLIDKNTPVWTVKRKNNKVQFNKKEKALEGIESYTDETTHSAFAALPDQSGYYIYSGVYNYDIGIKAPTRKHFRRRRHVNKNNETVSTVDHDVYTLPKSVNYNLETAYSHIISENRSETSKLHAPEIVFPQILVIMDNKLYSHYMGKMKDALSYIVTFWNAVDLKFRDFKKPEVRLNIAGIILEEEPGAMLNKSIILENGTFKGKVNRNRVLDDIGYNLYNSPLIIQKDYDLALYMMGNDLSGPRGDELEEKKHGLDGVLGVAKLGSACITDSTGQIIEAVGAFEDSNGYIGLLHGIHELGHLMGAVHDGQAPHPKLGLPGAESCNPMEMDDFIMSTRRIDGKQFSYCSKESMRIFFHKKNAECLRNSPMPSDGVISSIKLPGKVLSLDEQCQSAGFLRAYLNDKSVCDHLYCVTKGSNNETEYVTYLPGAEGSFCGRRLHCINGTCVDNENIDEYLSYGVIDRRIYIGK